MTEIDEKKGLLALCISLAYLTKCNFEDVYSPVRYWECYIASTLMKENTFIAISRESRGGGAIPGAFVAEPVPGFYDWVVSIDATALYPSIMKCLNLSPETLVGVLPNVDVDALLSGKTLKDFNITDDVSLAANGVMFSKNKLGIVPKLVDTVLVGRRIAKNEMLRLKQLYVDTKDPKYKSESDLQNVLQEALKVAANSFYGCMLQNGFIFYDARLGEAITLTGQYIIKTVSSHCDLKFNEFFKTKGVKYTTYMDTDSVFFTFSNIVDKYWKGQPDLKIVDALDTLVENKLRPYINEATDTIARVQNHYDKTIFFKRENICSGGFWIGKKRYALKVYDSEGVRYPDGDYKIMGIEVVRSSTPMLVRTALKSDIALIIDKKLDQLKINVGQTKNKFSQANPQDVAFPSSANNLAQYTGTDKPYSKGCPIGPRASLLYNMMLEKHNLFDRYDKINEGDKMKFIYLKLPNPLQENVIAFVDELPVEFGLHEYIDIETQYDKTYMKPLTNILEAIGWELEEKASLDDFF
jgi:DNA polymerase elongation subunit (family B)